MTAREQRFRAYLLYTWQVYLDDKVRELTGKNDGQYVETFLKGQGGSKGMPWCVAFLAHCYEKVCRILGEKRAIDIALSSSHAVTLAFDAKRIIPAAQAQVGDFLVLHGGKGPKAKDGHPYFHICGIASRPDANGYVRTIEGNTDDEGSAEGNGIFKRRRKLSSGVVIDVAPRTT